MFPFYFAPTIEYPLSGNVLQSISPDVSLEIEGIPEVEHEVITTVASYGKQLGKLTEAVLALADQMELTPEAKAAVGAVREISDGVEEAKTRALEAVRARAAAAAKRVATLEKRDG